MEILEKILLILVGLIILASFLFWVIPIFIEIDGYRDYVNDWEDENKQEEKSSNSFSTPSSLLNIQQDQSEDPLKIVISILNYTITNVYIYNNFEKLFSYS